MPQQRQAAATAVVTPVTITEKPSANANEYTDPLRARIYDLSESDKTILRDRLMSMAIKSIANLNIYDLQETVRFIDVCNHHRGCTTPTEDFIIRMLGRHYDCELSLLTPETLAEELDPEYSDGFQCNFTDAIDNARRLYLAYPKLVLKDTA